MNGRSLAGALSPRIIGTLRASGVAFLLVLLCHHPAAAEACGFVYTVGSNSFQSFDLPAGCSPSGINDGGQIVGSTGNGLPQGFIKDGNTFTTFNVPGANFTELSDINNVGQIVGLHGPGGRAFSTDGTTITSYDYPGAIFTYAFGINDNSQIVGKYRIEIVLGPGPSPGSIVVQDFDHALVIDGPIITSFDVPGARDTAAFGINNAGQIVGTWDEGIPGISHGFLKYRDTLLSFDYPGALSTSATGINDSGVIVGTYSDANNHFHGFIKDGDTFASLDFPDSQFTFANGINNLGQVVGSYSPTPHPPPFLPEPATILLVGCGLLAIWATTGGKSSARN